MTTHESGDTAGYEDGDDFVFTRDCVRCKIRQEVRVSKVDFQKWREGVLIQKAFPKLTADQREFFLSGICGKCWDTMFGEDT